MDCSRFVQPSYLSCCLFVPCLQSSVCVLVVACPVDFCSDRYLFWLPIVIACLIIEVIGFPLICLLLLRMAKKNFALKEGIATCAVA